MEELLSLNENAYFYRLRASLTNSIVELAFTGLLSKHMKAEMVFKKIRVKYKKERYSICIFKFQDSPSFIQEEKGRFFEILFGYVLLVEIEDYLILSRRYGSGIDQIYEYCDELPYELISKLYVEDASLFEKFNLRNMDISDAAIRNRTLEAINLKNSIPLLTSSRYVLRSMRVKNAEDRMSVSFSTSRINRVGVKRTFAEFMEWVIQVVDRIKQYKDSKNYIDVFPRPISLDQVLQDMKPQGILFIISDIISDLETETISKIFYVKGERRKEIKGQYFQSSLEKFERYLKLVEIEPRKFQIQSINTDGPGIKGMFIKVNEKSISINAKRLARIIIVRNGVEITLANYINQSQPYLMTFDKPNYIYFARRLFLDENLLSNAEQFLDVFVPTPSLVGVTSEKGETSVYRSSMTRFPEGSIFAAIEKDYSDSEMLVCDDLGNEWADYISISEQSIDFIHAKYSDSTFSASAFQEVVGQAQKNIGHFFSTEQDWLKKKDGWTESYRNYNVETKIRRVRNGRSAGDIVDRAISLSNRPNAERIIRLYVPYISKKALKQEIAKSRQGKKGKNQTTQMIWLISSLVSSCIEYNVKVYINCSV